jgi:hypothetical protein
MLLHMIYVCLGFLIYFCYGIWNSDENKNPSKPERNNNSRKSSLRTDKLNGHDNLMYNGFDFDTNFTKL